jgi:hypothetical protein
MTKTLLIFISLAGYLNTIAQIKFEQAYFIDNNNKRTECLIRNIDWKNNPVNFEYKLTESDEPSTNNIANVKEFGVINFSKYVREKVKIDLSSDKLSDLSYERNPKWSEEELFLKVLVEGNATLYYYEKGNLNRLFYKVNDKQVQQLIYKKYLAENSSVAINADFRQQLWMDMKCNGLSINSSKNLSYTPGDLIRYFDKFNACSGGEVVAADSHGKHPTHFNFRITPGLNVASIDILNYSYPELSVSFDKKLNYRVGVEVEFILPFNKNKWAMVFEPNYTSYSSGKKLNSSARSATVKYPYVELPIGIRHYFFLNNKSALFLNAFVVAGVTKNASVTYNYNERISMTSARNFALGGGYNYNRVGVELRCYTSRQVMNYIGLASRYSQFSFIVGYKLFQK